ncbi:carboxymuconolactone decarboxylase family protein [Paraburkholderia sp. GAS32]|jgi:alkylhydroperoxidase family enzyme|uniref:carboxymuconolactone decarboxylase family protein n=1 Tax=Paraburkholderia sp. GAS32 TaxID=3035129 RepID=UPI003D1EB738
MARVSYLSASDLSEQDRPLLLGNPQRVVSVLPPDAPAKTDTPANIYRAIANSPDGLRHWAVLGRWFQQGSELPARLRELAILQVGYLTKTPYQWSHHVEIGRKAGLSDDDIRSLIAATNGRAHGLGELETLVLLATREITQQHRMSDETWSKLLTKLGTPRLVDLTLLISHANAVIRVLATLDVDVEPEFQPFLEEFPLSQ